MTSSSPRYVIVDDNSVLASSSGWTSASGSDWDDQGNFGATYGGGMHYGSGVTTTFTTTFQGSAGRVTGTIDLRAARPIWECSIDDQVIPRQDPSDFSATIVNNFDLCAWGPGGDLTTTHGRSTGNNLNVTDGTHSLTVVFRNSDQRLLFDRFMFVPSNSTPLGMDQSDLTLELGVRDSGVEYSTGWLDMEGIGRMATDKAAVRIKFYGTAITWIGGATSSLRGTTGSAQWQMDGGNQNNFTVPAGVKRNVVFFETPQLERGHHTLIVTNMGLPSTMPLVLTRLWVHGGAIPEPVRPVGGDNTGDFTSTISQNSLPTNLPSGIPSNNLNIPGSSNAQEVPIGPIVGGVLGGLALIVVVIFAFAWIRKQTRVVKPNEVESQQIDPFNNRPSMHPRPSGLRSVTSDEETETLRTVVASEKKKKKKKAGLSEKQRLKLRTEDVKSITTVETLSIVEKTSEKAIDPAPAPLVPNRLAPIRRPPENAAPPVMPAIPEQQTYSPHPSKKGFFGRNHTKSPPASVRSAATTVVAPTEARPPSPTERHMSSSTYSNPPSTFAEDKSTVPSPPLRPNRRPPTEEVVSSPPKQLPSIVTSSTQRTRPPSPPPVERHASVSTYSRPPSTISPLTAMRSLWGSTKRTTLSELTPTDEDQRHISISTFAHPPSDVGHSSDATIVAGASGSSSSRFQPNRMPTTNPVRIPSPTLVESPSLSDLNTVVSGSSGTRTPFQPNRRPVADSTASPPPTSSSALSKQEEVAREAEAVANFTGRFRSRSRRTNAESKGWGRKKHKDAGVVLVPAVFTNTSATSPTTIPRSPGSPPGYSPPPA